MTRRRRPELAKPIEIVGELDPHDAEALQLELRRLAERHGIAIEELSIETSSPGRKSRSA